MRLKPEKGRLLDRKPGRENRKKDVMVDGIKCRTKIKETGSKAQRKVLDERG
jgi:hypothetical protein